MSFPNRTVVHESFPRWLLISPSSAHLLWGRAHLSTMALLPPWPPVSISAALLHKEWRLHSVSLLHRELRRHGHRHRQAPDPAKIKARSISMADFSIFALYVPNMFDYFQIGQRLCKLQKHPSKSTQNLSIILSRPSKYSIFVTLVPEFSIVFTFAPILLNS